MTILPVGHYTGALHPAGHHTVRVGREAVTFADAAAFAVWAAAHRPLERTAEPWTRETVAAAAAPGQAAASAAAVEATGAPAAMETAGTSTPSKIIDDLLRDGILVEVTDAEAFARTHRVIPIMVGLGNTEDDPTGYDIGLFGMSPVITVPALVNEIWQWGGVGVTLWAVCEAFAQAGTRAGGADFDAAGVLAEFLAALPTLVGANAAYVDVLADA
jgi:hypothetical protein